MEDRKLLVESKPSINRMVGSLKANAKPFCCWRDRNGVSYFLKRCDSVGSVYEVMVLTPSAIRFKTLLERDLVAWGKGLGL